MIIDTSVLRDKINTEMGKRCERIDKMYPEEPFREATFRAAIVAFTAVEKEEVKLQEAIETIESIARKYGAEVIS